MTKKENKYIDVEKLVAEIERQNVDKKVIEPLIRIITSLQQEPRFPQYDNIVEKVFGAGNLEGWERDEAEILVALAKEELLKSLQQEQTEGLHFTPLNRLIQKIPSEKWNDSTNNYAKNLRDCLIKEGYLKDAKLLQDYISYMNGNNVPMATMDEQEQPKVDLEKLGGIARHLIAVKDHEEDMRLDESEWLLLERIGYPERFNAKKED